MKPTTNPASSAGTAASRNGPRSTARINRREFLARTITASGVGVTVVRAADEGVSLVRSLTRVTLRRGRDGRGPTWFHPRACLLPGRDGPIAFMTLQTIGGSDYFGPVHWIGSDDLGRSWSAPQPVLPLGRIPAPEGAEEGVCDVVPEYHEPTRTVLALGHQVFYRGPRFDPDQPPRRPVYAVRRPDGSWSERRILEWDDPRGEYIYTNNCGQRVVLPEGDILLAFSFGRRDEPRRVAGVRCGFDGEHVRVREVGPALANPVKRGFLEPSLTRFDGRFWLTLRAEDDRGYVAVSDDGLDWSPPQPWRWDDGEPLKMSTTQQHWLTHSRGLFLVYTRRDDTNTNVIRWRSPLWMAEVDRTTRRLRRSTERTVFPLTGDGVNDPDGVALMGNFHVTNVSPDESWVTVGEWLPRRGARGDLLLARIGWNRPNELAPRW